MKYMLFGLIALLFVGCASIPTQMPESWNLSDINSWIYYNIEYDGVDKTSDTVQSAETTLALRSGSCWDMSNLFIYMSRGAVKLCPVVLPGGGLHMMVESAVMGFYDPTNNKVYGYELPRGWTRYTGGF